MKLTRQALLASFCLLTAVGANLLTPRQLLADLNPINLEQMVPPQFANWRALPKNDDVITSPEQDAYIKSIYSQVLSRVYVDDAGHRIMLSIAYTRNQSDNSGTQSHKPEICYPAQGFQIVSNQKQQLTLGDLSLPVRRLVAIQDSRIEPISYWTMVGSKPVVSGIMTKVVQMEYGVKGLIPDGLIFRVSNISNDPAEGFELHMVFINTLVSALTSNSKIRLIGGRDD